MSTELLNNELLKQLAEGDEKAFRDIYDSCQERVFAFALYLTKSKDIAEEVVQEVFSRLWEKRRQLPPDTNLRSYIRKMAENHIMDVFRKARRDKAFQQKIFHNMVTLRELATLQEDPADILIRDQLARLHQAAIRQLPPQKRIIYTLSRDEELTYEEIAQKLHLSRNTVRNHMADAIKSVREYITGHTDLACLIIAVSIWQSNK